MTEERRAIISDYLNYYNRRFSLLDIGAGIHTDISKVLSNKFDCVTTVLEKDIADLENYGPRTLILKHLISAEELKKLGESHHYDAVLALNVLHHFSAETWRMAADAVLDMGELVFVQVPNEREDAPGKEFLCELLALLSAKGREIAKTIQFPDHPSRPLFLIDNRIRDKKLTLTHMRAYESSGDITIKATLNELSATLVKYGGKIVNKTWVPGMNLWDFIGMHGVRPSKDTILNLLLEFPLPPENHGDIVPWNFIVDGETLHLVDGYEGWEFKDSDNMQNTIDQVNREWR